MPSDAEVDFDPAADARRSEAVNFKNRAEENLTWISTLRLTKDILKKKVFYDMPGTVGEASFISGCECERRAMLKNEERSLRSHFVRDV